MRKTLAKRGVSNDGAARKITRDDFARFDLILTMDDFNRQEVLAVTRSEAERAKVRPFCEFCTEHDETEVPDPYYGGDSGFEIVADLIEDGSRGLLSHIIEQLD